MVIALAALYVVVFGGIELEPVFSMSTPWRALAGLVVISGLRHYFVRSAPLHERIAGWMRSAAWTLLPLRCVAQAFERVTRMPPAQALHYFALTALAIAQPLFDVVAREPAFFVARNTTSGQLVGFVVILAVALPLLFILIEAVATRSHATAGNAVHFTLATALGVALVLPILKRGTELDTDPLIAVSLLTAVGCAFALLRLQAAQLFLTALSPAAIIVPVVFLANPDIRGAVVSADIAPVAASIESAPPIVLIVFDEFPTSSLMDAEREIDVGRYPNFARLAEDATWYRNASTVSSQTVWAVPAITTGKYPVELQAVPTLRYYPNNLFTMLSDSYEMTVFGRFLQLCAADTCTYDLEVHDTLWTLTADLAIVYAHIIAPAAIAEQLPTIVGDWRGFAQRRTRRDVDGERIRNDRAAEYERFLATITPDDSGRLYFLHSLSPHMPFQYVPSGTRYVAPDYQSHQENGEHLFVESDPWLPITLQQRHLLQLGFVDKFIGNLIDRLKAQNIYDEALIIITADHGTSFQDGLRRRARNIDNPADILTVPLIVKLPQQTAGSVSARVVETIDILPTIAEVLGARLPYEVDGQSLSSAPATPRPNRMFIQRNLERVRSETYAAQLEDPGLTQKLAHFGTGLYGLGPHAELVGQPLAGVEVGAALPQPHISLPRVTSLAAVNLEAPTLPLYVRGTIEGESPPRVSLGIALNGVIVATTVSYLEEGEWTFASMIPEDALVAGANEVEVVVLGVVNDENTSRKQLVVER